MSFFVYILKTSSDTLYIGQTNNIEKRLQEHKDKKTRSSKYMRAFSSFELVYQEEFATRSEAMKREAQLKKFTRKQKLLLLQNKASKESD